MSVKKAFLRTAGTALKSYLDDALRIGGNVGQEVATAALRAGKAKFAPDLVGKVGAEVPLLLREGSRATIPTACLLYTSPSPRDMRRSRMPSSA